MSEPPPDDASLVEALAGGNVEAARELYRRHCQPVLRFAVAMTDSRAAAEDIVHDTFVELLQRPGNYDPERGSLRAYLYGIARHRIAKSMRAAAIAPPDPDRDREPHGRLATAAAPEDQAERSQDIERLRIGHQGAADRVSRSHCLVRPRGGSLRDGCRYSRLSDRNRALASASRTGAAGRGVAIAA